MDSENGHMTKGERDELAKLVRRREKARYAQSRDVRVDRRADAELCAAPSAPRRRRLRQRCHETQDRTCGDYSHEQCTSG